MKNAPLKYLLSAIALAAIAACGGGGGGGGGSSNSGTDATPTPTPTASPTPTTVPTETPSTNDSKFTQSQQWQFVLPASGAVCYDFDAGQQIDDCSGTAWDVKVVSSGRTASLYTNSGPSGTGQGAALGTPFSYTWDDLKTFKDATKDPVDGSSVPSMAWIADHANSVFSGNNTIQTAAFEYDLNGDFRLSPNFRTFLITTDSSSADISGESTPVFALQMTGYYGSPTLTASGWPSFRFVNTANPSQVFTSPTGGVNASSETEWVYYDLASNAVSSESGTWHIAFKRYNIKLNGGTSGSGTVGGFLSKTPAGFYTADGSPVAAKFSATTNLQDTLADLTAGNFTAPARAANWVKDSIGSQLTPAYTGVYPAPLNYGWFSYAPTATAIEGLGQHQLGANPQAATLVRSGTGNSYARMRLASISYAAAEPAYSGDQTWTFDFDVQPAN